MPRPPRRRPATTAPGPGAAGRARRTSGRPRRPPPPAGPGVRRRRARSWPARRSRTRRAAASRRRAPPPARATCVRPAARARRRRENGEQGAPPGSCLRSPRPGRPGERGRPVVPGRKPQVILSARMISALARQATARTSPGGKPRDLRHHPALRRRPRQGVHRRVSGGLHLRGRPDALHPPRRVRGLRGVRAGLPGGGHLLRGRRPGQVEGLLQRQRGVLLRPRQPRRRGEDRQGRHGPPAGGRPAAAGGGPLTTVPAGAAAQRLPDFPWDSLTGARARAAGHPGGVVDLSIGTPVDSTPAVLTEALAAGAGPPGSPTALGTAAVRPAAADWLARRLGVHLADPLGPDPSVIPTVGSKELVALLPTLLGLQGSGTVLIPEVAYPTYEVGAVLAGLRVRRDDTPPDAAGDAVLVWLNSPGNPHGRVLTDDQLRAWVTWGRAHGVPVVADECYIELGWDVAPTSLLHPSVAGDDHTGLMAVHSLSKQSTAAGYRAGLLSGDPALVRRVWEVRRHLGLLVPTPVQAAMAAALADDEHVSVQRERYRRRRDRLAAAVRAAGGPVDHSAPGGYRGGGR